MYNAILHHKKQVPVHSILVLSRPIAHMDQLKRGVGYSVWPKRGRTNHRFEVIRLWQRPIEQFLSGGLGTLPLAPLCQMPKGSNLERALPSILRRIDERLTAEAEPGAAGKLWTATFVLTGLRTTEEKVLSLFQGVHGMKESTTYQYILREGKAEGRVEEVRRILLRQGQKRFGAPPAAVTDTLESLSDLDRMERMADRVLEIASWQELLDTP
jgi:hypothetical protein